MGQYYKTICGLLDSIKGKLDDENDSEDNSVSGQIKGYLNDVNGMVCDWGFPRVECWGVRLPMNYKGEIPYTLQMIDVDENEYEYIVFEHWPFNYEQENFSVEQKTEKAMSNYNYDDTGYSLDIFFENLCIFTIIQKNILNISDKLKR